MVKDIQLYFENSSDVYFKYLKEHIVISLQALLIAALIGILCGYFCYRHPRFEKYASSLFQMLRIIPSLAILFLLIPIIGTGTKPALIALVILGIPSILLHTILGFKEVPERVAETGIAIGMTQRQLLRKVRIPLALPYILNGIKIALIEIIASATLAAKIGAGGLGSIIFTGLGLNRTDLLVIGGLSVAMLSLLSSLLIERIEKMIIT